MNPKITVLMAVYNGEKYLDEAIKSILNQTFTDFEFLIINDASTDNSYKIIQSYTDPHINFINNENNLGLSGSLNRGLDIAKGQYIARMDQDDISLPERLEKQVRFMEENPEIGICGSWVKFFGEMDFIAKYVEYHKELISNMFISSPFAHPSVIFRKELFNKFNLRYNPDFKTGEDYELWTRASKYIKFANIQKVLLNYRISPNQMTKSTDTLENANKIIWKMQLENLGMNFSEEELTFHQLLLSEKYIITKTEDFLKLSNDWINKIISASEEKQIYDKKILTRLFEQKFYVALKNILDFNLDFDILNIFKSTKQFKYLSLENKYRLLYRYFRQKIKGEK